MWTPDPTTFVTAEQKATQAKQATLAAYKAAFDAHLDEVAKQRQYDSRNTIIAYANSTQAAWAAEANAFIAWRDGCLMQMFQLLAAVEAGERPAPTVPEFIGGLPEIAWPPATEKEAF